MATHHSSEFKLRTSDGTGLFLRRVQRKAPKGVVLLVHGVAEHSGRYVELEEWLVSHGFSFYGFDERGHGKSDGSRVHVDGFDDYVSDLESVRQFVQEEERGRPLFIYAHSMGCVVAIHHSVKHPTSWRGLVLASCPVLLAFSPPKWKVALGELLSRLVPRFSLSNELEPEKLSRDKKVGRDYEADSLVEKNVTARWASEFLEACRTALEKAPEFTAPLLMLHGEGDEIASLEGAERFLENAGSQDKSIRTYPNLRHELHHELPAARNKVFKDVTAWLISRSS